MSILKKISRHELNKLTKKPIVLFGSGNIAEKTIDMLGADSVEFVVDNSIDLQGGFLRGKPVSSPSKISKTFRVLICTTDISSVTAQLKGLGLVPDIDFFVSPLLNDLLAIAELEEIEKDIYFTSGAMPSESGAWGGGLFRCSLRGSSYNVQKLHAGQCFGIIKEEKSLLFVDTNSGIFRTNGEKLEKVANLPKHARAHGISYNRDLERYYVGCSKFDQVMELDKDFNEVRRLTVSRAVGREGQAVHHVNDVTSVGGSLYVTMFSATGSWKKDVFDGCIAEIDLNTGKRLGDIAVGLYMPHNVGFIDGSIHVLDSLRGNLCFGNLMPQATFSGFTRGLDYVDGLYFVGQSKNRNYSRVIGLSNNTSIDCGIVIFDPNLKVSRFLQFPPEIGQIHGIMVT